MVTKLNAFTPVAYNTQKMLHRVCIEIENVRTEIRCIEIEM